MFRDTLKNKKKLRKINSFNEKLLYGNIIHVSRYSIRKEITDSDLKAYIKAHTTKSVTDFFELYYNLQNFFDFTMESCVSSNYGYYTSYKKNSYFKEIVHGRTKSIQFNVSRKLKNIIGDFSTDNPNSKIAKLLLSEKIKKSYLKKNHYNFIQYDPNPELKAYTINYKDFLKVMKDLLFLYKFPPDLVKYKKDDFYANNISKEKFLFLLYDLRRIIQSVNSCFYKGGSEFKPEFKNHIYTNHSIYKNLKRETIKYKSYLFKFKQIKLGKVLTNIFNKVDNKDLEHLLFYIKESNSVKLKAHELVSEVEGELIKKYYNVNTYYPMKNLSLLHGPSSDNGLYGSCMREKKCSRYLDIYSKNKNVKLAILTDLGKVKARCILWKDIEDKIYFDRIYAINDTEREKLYKVLIDKKYANMTSKNRGLQGDNKFPQIFVKLNHLHIDLFPYFDTMQYLDISTSCLTNKVKTLAEENSFARIRNSIRGKKDLISCKSSHFYYTLKYINYNIKINETESVKRKGTFKAKDMVYIDELKSHILKEDIKTYDILNLLKEKREEIKKESKPGTEVYTASKGLMNQINDSSNTNYYHPLIVNSLETYINTMYNNATATTTY